jgi:hypothetical protein
LPSLRHLSHRCDKEGSGGATTKAEPAARRQSKQRRNDEGRIGGPTTMRERRRDDKGSGSALTKAEPAARRGRERQHDKEGSVDATTKAAAVRLSAAAR